MHRAAILATLIATGTLAQAADPVQTLRATRRVISGETVMLRTHAHWDNNCKAGAEPVITWVTPPAHGKVEQPVDMVKGHANVVGSTNCEGVEMRGLRLTYRSEPGFNGVDTLSYDVRYDKRTPLVRYEFTVEVQ